VESEGKPWHDKCLDEIEALEEQQAQEAQQEAGPICGGCGKEIEGKRLSAVDKKWHPECFVCAHCKGQFSAEEGFVESADLPYHEKCLDEIEAAEQAEAEAAAAGQAETGPICGGCGKAIEGKRMSAMEKKWHPDCFVCTHCKGPFNAEEGFVESDDQPWHEHCLDEVEAAEEAAAAAGAGGTPAGAADGPVCGGCGQVIEGKRMSAMDQKWHPECFVCAHCKGPFDAEEGFVEGEDAKPYHDKCLDEIEEMEEQQAQAAAGTPHTSGDPICAGCGQPAVGKRVSAMDKKWHPECFVCQHCKEPFNAEEGFVEENEMPYHEKCLNILDEQEAAGGDLNASGGLNSSKPGSVCLCAGCGENIIGKRMSALEKKWHPECFVCGHCRQPFNADEGFVEMDEAPYHDACLDELDEIRAKEEEERLQAQRLAEAPTCGGCGKPVVGKRMSAMNQKWHPECFLCKHCNKPFGPTDGFVEGDDGAYHESCLDDIEDMEQLAMQMNYALFEAARRGNADEIEPLLENKANINAQEPKKGWTAMHIAARTGSVAVINKLLDLGAKGDIKDNEGKTPILIAQEVDQMEVLTTMLEKGVPL